MKISKVDHVRTGVSEQPIEAGGMMYSYPDSENEQIVLRKHIKNLTEKNKRLYRPFVSPKTSGGKFSMAKECSDTFSFFLKKYVLVPINDGKSDEQIVKGIKDAGFVCRPIRDGKTGRKVTVKDVENTVNRCLRQSLRKKYIDGRGNIYIPDVMKKLCFAIYGKNDYRALVESIPENELLLLIKAIRADYIRDEYIEKIAVSIENQNVPIQVSDDGVRIILSSAYNKKKSYIFEFMKRYSARDTAGQEEMLKNMRYLILLYCFGNEIADDAENDPGFGAWNYGMILNEHSEEIFSPEAYDFWSAKENIPLSQKADIREFKDKIKISYGKSVVEHYQRALLAGVSDDDKKWIGYISDRVGKVLDEHNIASYKFTCKYIAEKIWEEWISFMAMKYVEMGKAHTTLLWVILMRLQREVRFHLDRLKKNIRTVYPVLIMKEFLLRIVCPEIFRRTSLLH